MCVFPNGFTASNVQGQQPISGPQVNAAFACYLPYVRRDSIKTKDFIIPDNNPIMDEPVVGIDCPENSAGVTIHHY